MISSYRYNKFTKTYYIDTIMDLMDCNAHQEYNSPYGDGYISHLLFETKLHNNKIFVKCKGFIVSDIIPDYTKDRITSMHYNFKAIYMEPPKTIKNLQEFESISLDKKTHLKIIEILVRNLLD